MKPTLITLLSTPLGRKFVDTFSYPWQSIQADNSVGKLQKICTQYNGHRHRLPLQPASRDGLLGDLYPIGESLKAFFPPWNRVAGEQDKTPLQAKAITQLREARKFDRVIDLPTRIVPLH